MTSSPATTPLTLEEIRLDNGFMFEAGRAHEAFKLVQALPDLHWTPPTEDAKGFWSLTRYADVLVCSRHPEIFSSERGIASFEPQDPAEVTGPGTGNGKMLITMDPPRHVKLRRLINKGFTPRAVAAWEPEIRKITVELLEEFKAKGGGDFVIDVASRIPLAVICSMLGLKPEDRPLMFKLTNKVLGAGDPEYQEDVPEDQRGTNEAARITGNMGTMQMFGFFAQVLQERKADRRDDLISILVDSELEGDKLSDEDILWFSFLLILAGNETTRNAMSGGLITLMEHPEAMVELRANPELMTSAVEEILRWVSPVTHMARVALEDTEINGQPIKKDERVIMWYPAVNRDPAVFPDGDVFDIKRSPNDHLAFGIGEHFCLGAGFARLELRVLFEELLASFQHIEPTGPAERLRSNFLAGIKHLPVAVS
ncbi:MAG: cytochrome P450 [Dehalococcoidia bacterium]